MKSKREPYDKNFERVGKTIKHRLGRRNGFFYKMDKLCSEMSSNELEVILNSHNRNKKDIMEEHLGYAENPEREFRTLQKVIRDWMNFKKRLEQDDWGKESIRLENFEFGVIMTQDKGAITYEYSEDETEIIVRDKDGNIIDRY